MASLASRDKFWVPGPFGVGAPPPSAAKSSVLLLLPLLPRRPLLPLVLLARCGREDGVSIATGNVLQRRCMRECCCC